MKKESIIIFLAMLFITSCATIKSVEHKYIMSGQVLDVGDNGVYLCIGTHDGAAVGQEYEVAKFVRVDNTGGKNSRPTYKAEQTGVVKITEIVDDHYAIAKIISGEVKVNYTVKLK